MEGSTAGQVEMVDSTLVVKGDIERIVAVDSIWLEGEICSILGDIEASLVWQLPRLSVVQDHGHPVICKIVKRKNRCRS